MELYDLNPITRNKEEYRRYNGNVNKYTGILKRIGIRINNYNK